MSPSGCFLVLIIIFSPSILEGVIAVNPDLERTSSSNKGVSKQQSCLTGNPIFECWHCGSSWWAKHRQRLADCPTGFGKSAIGGKGGQILVVTDSSDKDLINPKRGTLRQALIQKGPLWITFSSSMKIKLSGPLFISSFKTIDGRGADVRISGKGCLMLEDVSNVIIHSISIFKCVPSESVVIRKNETLVKHAGESKGNGIGIIRSHNIWVDNCTISDCTNDLIDPNLLGSTGLTFSNNIYINKSELLLDHQDNNGLKQVTTEYNRFGKDLIIIPPSRQSGAGLPHISDKVKRYAVVTPIIGFLLLAYLYWEYKSDAGCCGCFNENNCCNCFL